MFFVVDHPCVKAKLTLLRDERTDSKHFREYVGEITCFIAYEALKNLETEEIPVKTPLCETTGCRIRNSVAVVPILRAGIGMLDGILKLVPDATVGFVGLERDHVTAEPREYYCKLPAAEADSLAVVVDPMLAEFQKINAQYQGADRVKALLGLSGIFADDLPQNADFVGAVTAAYQQLCERGARECVAAL